MILVTPKQEEEQKKQVLLRREIFSSIFKLEWEYGLWKKIAFTVVVYVHMRQFYFDFLLFFCFLDPIFFWMVFPIQS